MNNIKTASNYIYVQVNDDHVYIRFTDEWLTSSSGNYHQWLEDGAYDGGSFLCSFRTVMDILNDMLDNRIIKRRCYRECVNTIKSAECDYAYTFRR